MDCAGIIRLKTSLPAYPAKVSGGSDVAADLQEYYTYYGFHRLESARVTHQLGTIDVGGRKLAVHFWQHHAPRGTVLVCHGLFDHCGLFVELIDHLLGEQYSVLAFDLPEHGLSSGVFGELSDFGVYAECIQGVLDYFSKQLPRPVIGLGQSTGAAALMCHALRYSQRTSITSLILLAPLIRAYAWTSIRAGHVLLRHFVDRVPRRFITNSHSEGFCEKLKRDPLQAHYIAVNWVSAMIAWEKEFRASLGCGLPTLVVQGTQDATVDAKKNMRLMESHFPNLDIVYVRDAMHHLACEADPWRQRVFAAIDDFLKQDGQGQSDLGFK